MWRPPRLCALPRPAPACAVRTCASVPAPASLDDLALSRAGVVVLDAMKQRHDEVSELLQSPDTPSRDINKLSKELGRLTVGVELYDRYCEVMEGARELVDMIEASDATTEDGREMAAMAREELPELVAEAAELKEALKVHLLPRDEADDRSVILEVRAGAGGDEAALFAGELLRMYERYAHRQGWSFELIARTTMEAGGVRDASASVGGDGVFGVLKFESGVHRVQRVPATESGGRTHTSTATVAVLPEAEDVDVDIKPNDLRIDTYRSQGAGGQHVNTTDSAVRITHLPTGVVVAIQDERSQLQNKTKAMQVLRSRLYEQQRLEKQLARSAARKAQVGTGDRSERVRTYNYLQDRVTDHRVAVSKFGIDAMLDGAFLDEFAEALRVADEAAELAALEEEAEAADDA